MQRFGAGYRKLSAMTYLDQKKVFGYKNVLFMRTLSTFMDVLVLRIWYG